MGRHGPDRGPCPYCRGVGERQAIVDWLCDPDHPRHYRGLATRIDNAEHHFVTNSRCGESRPANSAGRPEARTSATLIAALEPFANICADDGDAFTDYPDEVMIRCEISVGEIKAARDALKASKPR